MLRRLLAMPLALVTTAALAQSAGQSDKVESEDVTSSMGLVCWAAILESVSEIGRRCVADEDPDVRQAFSREQARLDQRLLQAGWTQDQLSEFKVQMGEHDRSDEQLCSNGDARAFYDLIAAGGPVEIVRVTDEMLARPGQPEWGTCL